MSLEASIEKTRRIHHNIIFHGGFSFTFRQIGKSINIVAFTMGGPYPK